jgi:hypothetical protein
LYHDGNKAQSQLTQPPPLTSLAIKAATPVLVKGLLLRFRPPIKFGLGADPDLLDKRNMVWGMMRGMGRNALHHEHLLKLKNCIP